MVPKWRLKGLDRDIQSQNQDKRKEFFLFNFIFLCFYQIFLLSLVEMEKDLPQ